MSEEELQLQEKFTEFIDTLDEVDYYYHLTPFSKESILENGLYVGNKEYYKSFNKFTKEELENIAEVILENKSRSLGFRTMIIAAVYKDLNEDFIRNSYASDSIYSNWDGSGIPDYIVDSEFLLGAIDLETLEFSVNEKSMVAENLFLL